jgi:hypothetical protein
VTHQAENAAPCLGLDRYHHPAGNADSPSVLTVGQQRMVALFAVLGSHWAGQEKT